MTSSPAQYLEKYKEQSIACSPYALVKLGVDKAHCSLKIEGYVVPCVPFQLGFKRIIFSATLSKQELSFFQKYVNSNIGVNLALNPDNRHESVKFSMRCPVTKIGQMKGRDDMGLFVIEMKSAPDELVFMIGNFLDGQGRLRSLADTYGKTPIKMTPELAKVLGYNMQATMNEAGGAPRRIQLYSFSSKTLEHLEAAGAPVLAAGVSVTYQIVFRKFPVTVAGTIHDALTLPQGLVRTTADLEYSVELTAILDDYHNAIKHAAAAKAK